MVDGSISYAEDKILFIPSLDLLPNTSYSVSLNAGIKDIMGKALNENYTWSFKTIDVIEELEKRNISVSANPFIGGITVGAGLFIMDSLHSVSAEANKGYVFSKWTLDGVEVSTNPNYEFTITDNDTLEAVFVLYVGNVPVELGSSEGFAILSNSAITNFATSSITGDVGISQGARSDITGLTLPEVVGNIYAANDAIPIPAMLINAKNDAKVAYLDAVNAARGMPIPAAGNLNGLTLVPGVYESGSSIEISPAGILYLDGQGDTNAVFVIRSATSITTESTSEVVLTNGAKAKNIF